MRALGRFSDAQFGAALALSYLVFSAIFWAYPFIWLLILSVSHWRFFDTPTFSGFNNLVAVLNDPEFWTGLWNTIRFFAFFLPITVLGS
ncbi:MAG: carbohydrate ABC transporter permease, partial [Gammaproteobacteria bacterium]